MRAPVLALICLLGTLSPAFAAEPADTPETRTAAAREYAAVANMPKMLDDAFAAASQQLPEADRAQFIALTKKYVNPKALEDISIAVMVVRTTESGAGRVRNQTPAAATSAPTVMPAAIVVVRGHFGSAAGALTVATPVW